jgi:spermidine/putrescine ABC transporter ATP-binding subunit
MGAVPGSVSRAAAVELRNVSKYFGKVRAVRDVTLEIRQNEFFSLLGPSGCGKTTILRMIGGFERPTTGEVHLNGRLVNDVPPYRRDTNLIFQHLALFPHLDVFDNIAFGLKEKRQSPQVIRQKVHGALELVDLQGLESRRITELSGGQKQRVAIARALVNEPAVLLLDEPLGALDLRLRVQMQEELKEIQHRVGTTFIYVTHDQTEALAMSDRIAVIRDGVVEQVGTGREVYEAPRTRFVATFIGESNILDARVLDLAGDDVTMDVGGSRVVAPARAGLHPGTVVSLSIRPEHMRIAPPARPDAAVDNWCQAQIRAVTFKGAFMEYRLITATGQKMIAQAPVNSGLPSIAGDSVLVGWRRTGCVVLSE